MKPQTVKILDSIIRESLYNHSTKSIDEQVIPTPKDLKYSWENNIKTDADKKDFRTWVRITYPEQATRLGLLSQEKVNTLDATKQNKQRALLKTAWKTYGKTYLEDQGKIDVETDPTHWYTPTTPKVTIGLTILFTILSLALKFKWLPKIVANRLARRAAYFRGRIQLGRTELSPTEVEELVDGVIKMNRRDRKQYLLKVLSREINPKQAQQLANEFERNPALQNEVLITLRGEAAENFVNGRGVDEAAMRKIMGREAFEAEKDALRARRAAKAKSTKKPAVKKPTTKSTSSTSSKTSSTSSKAISIKTMGLLRGTSGSLWTNLTNSSASAEQIRDALKFSNRSSGTVLGLKALNQTQETITTKLSLKLGNKKGAYILTNHMKMKDFPSYIEWVTDLKTLGKVTRKLTETDYIVSKSIWKLAK